MPVRKMLRLYIKILIQWQIKRGLSHARKRYLTKGIKLRCWQIKCTEENYVDAYEGPLSVLQIAVKSLKAILDRLVHNTTIVQFSNITLMGAVDEIESCSFICFIFSLVAYIGLLFPSIIAYDYSLPLLYHTEVKSVPFEIYSLLNIQEVHLFWP